MYSKFGSNGFNWFQMDSDGFKWIQMDSNGFNNVYNNSISNGFNMINNIILLNPPRNLFVAYKLMGDVPGA